MEAKGKKLIWVSELNGNKGDKELLMVGGTLWGRQPIKVRVLVDWMGSG